MNAEQAPTPAAGLARRFDCSPESTAVVSSSASFLRKHLRGTAFFFPPSKLRRNDADPTGSADRAKCRDRRVLSGRGSVRTTVSPCRSDVVRSASTAVALYDRSTHLRGHIRPPRPPPPPGCVRSSSTASGSTTTVSICTALTDQHRQHRAVQLPPTACPVIPQDVSTTRRCRTTT